MYRNLAAEKARFGITNEQFARAIGKSRDTIDKKMSGGIEWRLREMLAIRDKFFPKCTLDYLFAKTEV